MWEQLLLQSLLEGSASWVQLRLVGLMSSRECIGEADPMQAWGSPCHVLPKRPCALPSLLDAEAA